MKKSILVITLTLLLASCIQQSMKIQESPQTNLEKFVDDFMARYPKGLDNDAQKERMNEAFKNEIKDSLSNSSWL